MPFGTASQPGSDIDYGGADWLGMGPKKRKPTGDAITDALNASGDEAFRIRDEEERRGAATEGFLRDEFGKASQPTLTDDTIAKMFSQQSDAAARTQLDQEAGLRDTMGASGIQGGGYAQGILSGFESQRWARTTDARTSLAITKATSDANDRLNRFKNAQVLAMQMGRDPSTAGSDFLNDAAGITFARYGVDRAEQAQKAANKSALLGGAIKGGLGLLSGFLA